MLKLPRVPGWGSRKVQGPAHALHKRAAYAPSLTLGGAAGVWTRAGAWFGYLSTSFSFKYWTSSVAISSW